jgi:hypothetical protein
MSGKYKYNSEQLKVKQRARYRRIKARATKRKTYFKEYVKEVAFTQVQLRKN